MNHLDSAELSALLDGELDPVRASEVEAMIAADPSVRAEFQRLQQADLHLRSIAEAAGFRPEVRWPAPASRLGGPWLILPLAVILLAWAAGKLAPGMTMALAVNAASLLLFLACLAPLALRDARSGAPVAA